MPDHGNRLYANKSSNISLINEEPICYCGMSILIAALLTHPVFASLDHPLFRKR
jgi:hypothetical protein